MDFLLGADDQVAIGKHGFETLGDPRGSDKTLFAGGVTGQTPEIGPVVNIKDDLAAGVPGDADCLALRLIGVRARKMRAGDENGLCRRDKTGIDVVLAKRHVGAVLPVENQRKCFVILHR